MKKSLSAFKVLFVLVIALSAVFGFVGCNNPAATPAGNTDLFKNVKPENIPVLFPQDCVNYIANNSDFVFDVDYTNVTTGDYPSTTNFKISKNGVVSVIGTYNNDVGTLVSAFNPYGYDGILMILKMETHSNLEHYQYPDYNEENPHEGCYSAVYIKDISANSVTFAQMVITIGIEPPSMYGNPLTTCATTFDAIKDLFKNYGYEKTCAAYSSVCTR